MPQSPKISPTPVVNEPEQKNEELETPIQLYKNRWVWMVLGALIGLLAYAIYQQYPTFPYNAQLTSDPNVGHTTIEAQMSSEGFKETDAIGFRGQVCVENAGDFPTENLSIVTTVQINSTSTVKNISRTVGLGTTPVLGPGRSNCYPFEITFDPGSEKNAQYHTTTTITITNHTGLIVGSKYCPGPQPCPFGPEISTNLILPEQ
jgi:hypothetical protein